jgi:hypothetical protein
MTEPDIDEDLERSDTPLTTDPDQQRGEPDPTAGEGGAG